MAGILFTAKIYLILLICIPVEDLTLSDWYSCRKNNIIGCLKQPLINTIYNYLNFCSQYIYLKDQKYLPILEPLVPPIKLQVLRL